MPNSKVPMPGTPSCVQGRHLLALGLWLGLCLGLLLWPTGSAHAQADRPTMPNIDPAARMAPPPMSEPPTQLEWGHYNYWLSCMVCHGDRGQGLTDEWRTAGNADGENCWQARCHAASHPPEGFELPRVVPPVIGQYALLSFQTVGDLQTYLKNTMPWYAPGLLDDETYWQLATYLSKANGAENIPDNPDWTILAGMPMRASIPQPPAANLPNLQPSPEPGDTGQPAQPWLPVAGMVAVALGASVVFGLRRRL